MFKEGKPHGEIESANIDIFDDESLGAPLDLPLPISSAETGKELTAGLPPDRLGKVGPFITDSSPESHHDEFRWAVDFLVKDGTPVLAMRDGEVWNVVDGHTEWGDVSFAGKLNYITLKHDDGTFTQYCHLAPDSAKDERGHLFSGDKIKKGQQIAIVGKTGWTDRDHLHVLAFKNDDNPQNPAGFKSLKISWNVESNGSTVGS